MTKKHYYQIAVCSLVIFISIILFCAYYNKFIKPKSYVIGSPTAGTYKALDIIEYLSDDIVLFSQDISDENFTVSGDTATYEYQYGPMNFNGLDKQYLIYVNDYCLNDITTNAGTISAKYNLKFYDIDKSILSDTQVNVNFSSYTKYSIMRVTLPKADLPLLMRHFELNNFIITLTESPFKFGEVIGAKEESTSSVTLQGQGITTSVTQGVVGHKTTLTQPEAYDGHAFVRWQVAEGNGVVEGNTFTFGTENTVLTAVYDCCEVVVSADMSFTYTYNGETATASTTPGMTLSSAEAYVVANSSDSISVSISSGNLDVPRVTTDGEYTVTEVSSNSYTISWTNATSISIVLKKIVSGGDHYV